MKEGKTSRGTMLAGWANQIKMVQADCADQSDALRIQCLDDKIGEALEKVLPQDRAAFLEDLRSYFPTWHAQGETAVAASAPAPVSTPASPPPLDAEAHAKGLAVLAATLSEEKKQHLTRYLAKFGFASPNPSTVPAGASATLKETLGINSSDPLDVPRVFEAMAVLAQFTSDLDEVVWATWKQIAPVNSSIRREMDLKRVLSAFVLGDANAPKLKVSKGVESLRRLIAALTASIPQAGRTASSELRKVSVDEVEKAVTAEGGRGVFNFEKRCWQKYKDLSESTKTNVESTVRKSIAQVVEEWMK